MHTLTPGLPPEQKERLQKVEKLAVELKVLENMNTAVTSLKNQASTEAVKLQWDMAGDLAILARALRTPKDKLEALKEAKERIDRAIDAQKAITEKTENPKEDVTKKIELPTEQGRLQHETRDVGNLLKQQEAGDLSDHLQQAQNAMDTARTDLQTANFDKAAESQKAATENLQKVRDALDKQIAAAEKEKNDPLAALKNLSEQVDKIIAEQKDLKDKSSAAQTDNQPDKLPQQAAEANRSGQADRRAEESAGAEQARSR